MGMQRRLHEQAKRFSQVMSGVVAQHLPLEDVPQQHTLKPPHTDFANNCSLPKVFREITASKASNMTF